MDFDPSDFLQQIKYCEESRNLKTSAIAPIG